VHRKASKKIEFAKKYISLTLTKHVQESLVQSLLATPSRRDVDVPAETAKLVTLDANLIWFADEEFNASKQREWLDRYIREVQS